MGLELSPEQRGSSPEELALLLKEGDERPHYVGELLPIDVINVLPQPRQTFESIQELARDIADKGLMTPIIIARLDRESCINYLKVIGSLWQTKLGVGSLISHKEEDGEFFYILIAGERRYRAFRYLETEGCGEDHGGENCFEYHFPNRLIETRLCIDIPPLQAIFLQASENIHMRVPAHEEARFYYNLFMILREVDEKYPLAAFARKVGRSESTVRKAIRFCELPLDIQKLVEQGVLVYGKALEIARLIDMGIEEANLGWMKKMATVQNQTVQGFRDWVTRYIGEINSGQTMLGLFTEFQEEAMKQALVRRTVGREVIQALWQRIAYVRLVIKLIEEGKLGKKDSPFSIRSPVRVFFAFIKELEELLPLLEDHLSEARIAEAKEVIKETKLVLDELGPLLPEDEGDLDPYSRAFKGDQQSPLN